MCGIAGIWNLNKRPVEPGQINTFVDTLAHRGPDGRGTWFGAERALALGHRRLAILDLSDDGRQPMEFADGRYCIVYNGEVYNFVELRRELETLGHCFRSNCDTEVIVAAFAQWGEDCLHRFNGMWAFAIWDRETRRLFLARDRFGIKPLLYSSQPGCFAFASELKAFKRLSGFNCVLDEEVAAVAMESPFEIEGGPQTLLRGVQRLQGGHWASVTPEGVTIRRWWRTVDHLVDVPSSLEDQAERFREIFADAVAIRMRSDVPIGTCLSGGFDSSAVAAMMAGINRAHAATRERAAQDWQHAFIASFPGQSIDETETALKVARFVGVAPHVVKIDDDTALVELDQILDDFEAVYVGIPTAPWVLYRELRRSGVVVSLDGHGADELMGGYRAPDYLLLQDAPSWLLNPRENLRRTRLAASEMAAANVSGSRMERLAQALRMQVMYHPDFRWLKRAAQGARSKWKASSAQSANRRPWSLVGDDDVLPSEWGDTNRMLYRKFHSTVLPTILRNFDRVSMAHGIEVRMPFMDWRLVTYVMSLPDDSKIGGGLAKRVAREAMRGSIPEEVRNTRVKIGFNAPLPQWLNGPLRPWVEDLCDQAESAGVGMPFSVKGLSREYQSRQKAQAFDWRTASETWLRLNLLHFNSRMRRKNEAKDSP